MMTWCYKNIIKYNKIMIKLTLFLKKAMKCNTNSKVGEHKTKIPQIHFFHFTWTNMTWSLSSFGTHQKLLHSIIIAIVFAKSSQVFLTSNKFQMRSYETHNFNQKVLQTEKIQFHIFWKSYHFISKISLLSIPPHKILTKRINGVFGLSKNNSQQFPTSYQFSIKKFHFYNTNSGNTNKKKF